MYRTQKTPNSQNNLEKEKGAGGINLPDFLTFQVAPVVKNLPVNAGDAKDAGLISGSEDLLEKEMAVYSSIPAWKTPWTERPGRLQSMGSQRDGHN